MRTNPIFLVPALFSMCGQIPSSFSMGNKSHQKRSGGSSGTAELAIPLDANQHFYIPDNVTYLNVATLGPMPRMALESTVQAWQALESNPAEHYDWTHDPPNHPSRMDEVLLKAGAMLGVDDPEDELTFVQSTTEALHLVAQGMVSSGYLFRKSEDERNKNLRTTRRVLTTNMEHLGGLSAWTHQVASGFLDGVDYLEIPSERPPQSQSEVVELFRNVLLHDKPRKHYAVVSVSHVLATTGMILPIAEIASMAHAHGALFVVDGAQAPGAVMNLNLTLSGADAYTISGHKGLLGPTGSGLLYIRGSIKATICPGSLDDGYRSYSHSGGTSPFQTIFGLGQSLDFIQQAGGLTQVARHGQRLASQMYQGLNRLQSEKYPLLCILSPGDAGTITSSSSHPQQSLSSSMISVALPPGVAIQEVLAKLRDLDGRRFVVKNLADHQGAPSEFSNALRVSFHMYNSSKDVELFLEALETALDIVGKCQSNN